MIQDQLCQECHASGSLATEKVGEYDPETGQQVLFSVNLIQNGPECTVCHAADNKVLGLLIIESPMTLMNQQLAAGIWQSVLRVLLTSAVLVGLLAALLNQFVFRPVHALSKGVEAISSGNLDYEVKAIHQDELGRLAESFDLMRQRLKETYTEIDRREKRR